MDFTVENFDFKTNLITSRTEIDELLEEFGLQIKSYELKLGNRDLQLDKAQNRTESLGVEITQVQALIASKETEMNSFAEGTRKREEISIELDTLRARLRRLNFRKTDSASPASVVEKNADSGEAELLLKYFTRFKEALEQRKAQL
jgi:chromosome segregation ATPase